MRCRFLAATSRQHGPRRAIGLLSLRRRVPPFYVAPNTGQRRWCCQRSDEACEGTVMRNCWRAVCGVCLFGEAPLTDLSQTSRHVRKVPMLSKKSFWGNRRNYLEPLTRFVRSDVRDHIASQKNDHEPWYRRCRVSQRPSDPKTNICEIFGVVRFSTFSTVSAKLGSRRTYSITTFAAARMSFGKVKPRVSKSPKQTLREP
jgi:hypothetical protein